MNGKMLGPDRIQRRSSAVTQLREGLAEPLVRAKVCAGSVDLSVGKRALDGVFLSTDKAIYRADFTEVWQLHGLLLEKILIEIDVFACRMFP